MSANAIIILVGWVIALAIFLGFITLVRYLEHRERMALISRGMHPGELPRRHRNRGILRAGLITMMVGFALTIGLYPIGFILPSNVTTPLHLGPWLLPGLIPFGVGFALTISYYLEQSPQTQEREPEKEQKVIPISEHRDRERRDQ